MFKKLGIGCLGMIVLLVIVSAFASQGTKTPPSTTASAPTPAPAAASKPVAVSGPATTAAPKPAEGPKVGSSRNAPVPMGEAIKVADGKSTFEVKVIQVERNAAALVKKANMLNADPEPGMDYVAIKMALKYISGPDDKPVTTPSSGTSLFAKSKMWGTKGISVPPEPKFGGEDIFPGAEIEGWIDPVQVPKESMDETVLSYGKGLFGGNETSFALK